MNQRNYKNIIIGAGASGLMLASLLRDKSNTLVIDTNPKIGAKISISGGGRCNLTNKVLDSDNYLGSEWFVESVLGRFNQNAVLDWFAERGLLPELRTGGEYFCKRSADEVLEIFRRETVGVGLALNTRVNMITKQNGRFVINTSMGDFESINLIIASGGISFPKLGASDIGHRIAEQFGHTIVPLAPALVGFTVQKEQFFFKELSGSSVFVQIVVGDRVFEGNLLFTHRGISGPVILNSSLYWKRGVMEVDFLPEFELGLLRGKKQISTILPLSKKVAKTFLNNLNIEDKPAEKLADAERIKIKIMKQYSFTPAGTFGYGKAEVTRGGVSTNEMDPYSMMSLKETNLYFIGEVLDVTGQLGGYNFQWAFSSAFACAEHLNS